MIKKIKEDKLYHLCQAFLLVVIISLPLYIYSSLPENAVVTLPGPVITYAEEIGEEVNLNKVSVYSFPVEKRADFIKFLWKNKIWPGSYSYVEYDNFNTMVIEASQNTTQYLKAKRDKYQNLPDYFNVHYPGEEVLRISKIPESLGDSDGLGLALCLFGSYTDAHWVKSDLKIVITGAMDAEGIVRPVGDIHIKGIAAVKNDTDIFMVPQENYNELALFMKKNKDIIVVPVTTIEEAKEWLNENA
ncbi:S16 family serine protease [Metaplanococcus flavidus]|uniref:S16 family serine protease n=1 Tax=Metaplanococcus flavidus TaxID=569883 RepID=A0ABW3LDR3_9BACL